MVQATRQRTPSGTPVSCAVRGDVKVRVYGSTAGFGAEKSRNRRSAGPQSGTCGAVGLGKCGRPGGSRTGKSASFPGEAGHEVPSRVTSSGRRPSPEANAFAGRCRTRPPVRAVETATKAWHGLPPHLTVPIAPDPEPSSSQAVASGRGPSFQVGERLDAREQRRLGSRFTVFSATSGGSWWTRTGAQPRLANG